MHRADIQLHAKHQVLYGAAHQKMTYAQLLTVLSLRTYPYYSLPGKYLHTIWDCIS